MAKRARIQPRKSPLQERSAATVSAILEASARELAKNGYARASVNRIAERAGVSPGSLYQYFPSKESLLLAVAKGHIERMIAIFHVGLPALAFLPPSDAVRGLARLTLAAYRLDPELRVVLLREEPKFGAIARQAEFDDTMRTIFLGWCAVHADEVRPTNVPLAVKLLMAAVEAAAVAVIEDAGEDEIVDELAELVMGYLMKR